MHGLITEIQSLGVRVDRHISGRKGGAGPADGRAFVIDGKVVMVPLSGYYVDRSPYLLREDEGGYLLVKDEKTVARPEIVREPAFYAHSADDGVPFRKIALLHGKGLPGHYRAPKVRSLEERQKVRFLRDGNIS